MEANYRGDTAWQTVEVTGARGVQGSRLERQEDGSVFVSGPNPKNDTYELDVATPLQTVTGFRLETIPDPRNPAGGAGRSPEGRFF